MQLIIMKDLYGHVQNALEDLKIMMTQIIKIII